MSEAQKRAEELIAQAQHLLRNAQAAVERKQALFQAAGIDDPQAWADEQLRTATPAQRAQAERIAQEQVDAIERSMPPRPMSERSAQELPRARPRKFRSIV